MRTNFFFTGSWTAQVIVGFGLFFCSFFIEYSVLVHFVTPSAMALMLAVTLEGGKITAIIWHYYLNWQEDEIYPLTVKITSLLFRLGLVSLSLICSMLFFTAQLDRPHLQAVRQERLAAVNSEITQHENTARQRLAAKRTDLLAEQKRELADLSSSYDTRIHKLESLLLGEMDNVVNGVFKGQRYLEFEKRLNREKQDRTQATAQMRKRHRQELEAVDTGADTLLAEIRHNAELSRNRVQMDDFSDYGPAHDKRIVALLKTVESITGFVASPLQFVFFFSILMALLMEAGIILSFATITVAIAPLLHARHIEELQNEACRVRTESIATRDKIDHEAAINRIRKAGKRTLHKAEAAFSRSTT